MKCRFKITYPVEVNKITENVVVLEAKPIIVKDNFLYIEVLYEKEIKPKDGDILKTLNGGIFIYRENNKIDEEYCSSYIGKYPNNDLMMISLKPSDYWAKDTEIEGFANDKEKQDFFKLLETKYHRSWNPDTKQLEICKPRALSGEKYYYITELNNVASEIEKYSEIDNNRFKSNNYFLNIDNANKAKKYFNDYLTNFYND